MFYKVIENKEDKHRLEIDEKDKYCPISIIDLSSDTVLYMTKEDGLELAHTIINYYSGNKVDK